MRKKLTIVLASAGLFLAAAPLCAHHAFAAEFDGNRPIKLRGTVTRLDWINPHSWIYIDVKGPDGKVVGWMIEGGSPNALLRLGFTKDALPVGSEAGNPRMRVRTAIRPISAAGARTMTVVGPSRRPIS